MGGKPTVCFLKACPFGGRILLQDPVNRILLGGAEAILLGGAEAILLGGASTWDNPPRERDLCA